MKAKFSIFSKLYTSLKQERDVGKSLCLKTLLGSMQTANLYVMEAVLPRPLVTHRPSSAHPDIAQSGGPWAPCSHTK